MFATRSCTFVLSLAVLTGTTAKTQTPSFTLDGSFQGSSLAGWHTLGQAAWSASDARDKSAPGGACFVPELIHNRSGVRSDVLAVDLNGDGANRYRNFDPQRNVHFLGDA